MIDLNKPVRTRDGREVKGLTKAPDDAKTEYALVGWVDGNTELWLVTGAYFRSGKESANDLVNYEPDVVRFVNEYDNLMESRCAYDSAEEAIEMAATGRIGTIKQVIRDGKLISVELVK